MIFERQKEISNLKLCCNRSKLDNVRIGIEVVWSKDSIGKEWQKRKIVLGSNKKIFHAEMRGISEAFKTTEQRIQKISHLR